MTPNACDQVLQGRISYLLKRPVGRPSNEVRRFYANFSYQAGSWTKPRRVNRQSRVASGRALSARRLYRHQPDAPGRAGRLQRARYMRAIDQRRQGCDQVDAAAMQDVCGQHGALQLHALAYNLGNFLRTLATPEPIKKWSLRSLKEKLIKIGAKW